MTWAGRGTPFPARGWEGRLSFANRFVALAATASALTTAARNSVAALLARACFIDRQGSTVDLVPVEGRDRGLRLIAIVHLDKAKAFRAAGIPIHDDLGRLHRTVRHKQILQIAVGHLIGQVADIQLLGHAGPPSKKSRETSQAHSGPVLSHEKASIIAAKIKGTVPLKQRDSPLYFSGSNCELGTKKSNVGGTTARLP